MRVLKVQVGINGYPWEVHFVPAEEFSEDTDGTTDYKRMVIKVRDDLDAETTLVVIRHELTHAYLCSEGRHALKSMTQEELCEWVGWHAELIATLAANINASRPFKEAK